MKKNTCREIIAHAIYQLRKEANLEEFGSVQTDQDEAERIIKFFTEINDKDIVRDWRWERNFEDYRMYQSICENITDV